MSLSYIFYTTKSFTFSEMSFYLQGKFENLNFFGLIITYSIQLVFNTGQVLFKTLCIFYFISSYNILS